MVQLKSLLLLRLSSLQLEYSVVSSSALQTLIEPATVAARILPCWPKFKHIVVPQVLRDIRYTYRVQMKRYVFCTIQHVAEMLSIEIYYLNIEWRWISLAALDTSPHVADGTRIGLSRMEHCLAEVIKSHIDLNLRVIIR